MILKSAFFLLGMSSLLFIADQSQAEYLVYCALSCLALCLFLPKPYKQFWPLFVGLAWAGTSVVIWSNSSERIVSEPLTTTMSGYVCGIPEYQTNSIRTDFCLTNISLNLVPKFSPNKIRLTWGQYADKPNQRIKAGQWLSLSVKLKPIHGRSNPGGFEFEKWMISENYLGSASVKSVIGIYQSTPAQSAIIHQIKAYYHLARGQFYNQLLSTVEKNQFAGLILAITFAEKSLVSDEQIALFRQTGTSHLLAISGLHIGIAALWSYWLVSFLWRQSRRLSHFMPAKKIGQIAALIGALGLLLISGFGLPAQRAMIMLLVFIIVQWTGRNFHLSRSISWAVIVVLLIHPFAVLSASFWLSFFAVVIICAVISGTPFRSHKIKGWLKINVSLFIALIPISLLFFQYFSIVSIVANLLFIPLVSFIITPITYFGLLITSIYQSGAEILFVGVDKLFALMQYSQQRLVSFDTLSQQADYSVITIALLFVLTALVLLPLRLLTKAIILPILLLVYLLEIQTDRDQRVKTDLEIIVFDIGQGLAIYIETAQGNLLYDTGWGNETYQLAESVLLPFFESRQIVKLDKLVVSHADSDHAGGVSSILESLTVSDVITGEALPVRIRGSREVSNCHQFKPWQWGQVKFKFLSHIENEKRSGNNASCVLSVSTKQKSILLTGDIEKNAEKALIQSLEHAYNVLVAPHHGSKTSSTTRFINKVLPQHVIFSTGYGNQWDFPRNEVLKRYEAAKSQVWTTHIDGAITIRVNEAGELKIQSFKQSSPHFWLKY